MTDPIGYIWPGATRYYREELLRIVADLFFMLDLDEGGADRVPRRVWRRIVRVLGPVESAARRLIYIAASRLAVAPPRPTPERPPVPVAPVRATGTVVVLENVNFGLARAYLPPAAEPRTAEPRLPAFALADPPRRFDPRAWDGLRPFPQDGFTLANPDAEVSARSLCRRLQALKRALDDLDGHALRLARRLARESAAFERENLKIGDAVRPIRRARQRPPIRLGHPPGHRRHVTREADDILRECHALALQVMPSDTS